MHKEFLDQLESTRVSVTKFHVDEDSFVGIDIDSYDNEEGMWKAELIFNLSNKQAKKLGVALIQASGG